MSRPRLTSERIRREAGRFGLHCPSPGLVVTAQLRNARPERPTSGEPTPAGASRPRAGWGPVGAELNIGREHLEDRGSGSLNGRNDAAKDLWSPSS